ncbi:PspA/IM30 family protein [Candidatus Poribacteria bacterium]|nr:PspA/IM30 family protein [Candidatus Poribacteria bacterium]
MKFIEIAGKKFKLASRMARLYALFIDIAILGAVQSVFGLLLSVVAILFLSESVLDVPKSLLTGVGLSIFAGLFSAALWIFGLFFMDGFRKGQGIGKKLLSLQVLRLKDGKPCNFKDAFVRRFAGIFQPFDLLWFLGKNQQRLGDKFAETVVVQYEPESEQTEVETEDPESVLESVIVEMKNRLSAAREKVAASIGVEKQFQDAYEEAIAQAEQWQARALITLKAGREDLAREDLEKRNEYRRLADQYKTQWGDQKQIVRDLSDLLEHLQQKMMEAEGKKTAVVAKHRNVDAEAHLREMLKEIQDSKAFETLTKMDQDATEAATLAKTAAEVDVAYQDAKLEREFSSYAEEASLDKDLAELKTKIQ